MQPRRAVQYGRAVGTALLAAALAGCAAGYSRSIAMAPIRYATNAEGDLEISRADGERDAPFISLAGDFRVGASGYDVVGGNALLPARLLAAPPAGGLVGLADLTPAGPAGELVDSLVTPTTATVTAALDGAVTGLAEVAPPLTAVPTPSALLDQAGGAVAALAAPVVQPAAPVAAAAAPTVTSLAPVAAPLVEPAAALVTQGPILAAVAPPPAAPTTATALAPVVTSVLTLLRPAP